MSSISPTTTLGTVAKWAGSITAILTLIFGVRQLYILVTNRLENNQQIEQRLGVHAIQRSGGDFAAAWETLLEADKIDPGREDVQQAREDLAMQWLRRIRVRQGEQTFTDIVQRVQPVLVQGTLNADSTRKADLLAHLGWSDFLRWRDGRRDVRPENYYRQALQAEARNVYAHVMWAHWILWQKGRFEDARTHFEQAVVAAREIEYVRELQIAALISRGDSLADRELLRIAHEMRNAGDTIDSESRKRIIYQTCPLYTVLNRPVPPVAATNDGRLSPDEELAALRWLSNGLDLGESRELYRDYCLAYLHEAAGRPDSALVVYRTVRERAPANSTLLARANAAVRRLTRPSPQ